MSTTSYPGDAYYIIAFMTACPKVHTIVLVVRKPTILCQPKNPSITHPCTDCIFRVPMCNATVVTSYRTLIIPRDISSSVYMLGSVYISGLIHIPGSVYGKGIHIYSAMLYPIKSPQFVLSFACVNDNLNFNKIGVIVVALRQEQTS